MQAQRRLLLLRLRGHRSHSSLLHSRPDRARIRCVGPVRLYEGPNELRVQQEDVVPQRLDLACPPVPTPAGLQRNPAWRPPRQVLDQIVAPEPAAHDLARVPVDPVTLEHSLRYIQSLSGGMHLETSVLQGVVVELPLRHTKPTAHPPLPMAHIGRKGGVHSISAVWEQVLETESHAAPMAFRAADFHLNLRFMFG
jgi:hypothetical protein